MVTLTRAITEARPSALSWRWIINTREDLIWFIGSVASSYLLLVLYLKGLVPLIPMVALWAILVDAPHVFGTFSRTYFDRSERHHRARLLWASLLFFAVGPLMVLLGAAFVFFFFAALWAYYHLVKQHYGFMVLYKKKNGDLAPVDNALDRLLLLFAFNYPFVAFMALDPEAMARVPLILQGGVNALAMILLAGTIVLGALWIGRQIQRAITGLPLNVPKYLLLAAAIPMHWIVLLTPMPHKPIAIVAILTIYHNLQYHRLIWFHNKKYAPRPNALTTRAVVSPAKNRSLVAEIDRNAPERHRLSALETSTAASDAIASSYETIGRERDELHEKYGAAALISRRLLFYVAFGIIFGLIYQGPRQYLGYLSLTTGDATGGPAAQPLVTQLGVSFLWGYAFIHYYLDSKIWRVRRDPSVGKALNMA